MTITPPNFAQQTALLAIYNLTYGPGGNNKSGWRTANSNVPENVILWNPEVEVDGNGHVTGLNLSENSLFGLFPTQIGVLGYLYSLKLQRNSLYGSLPSSIGNMTNLTYLDKSQNKMSGNLLTDTKENQGAISELPVPGVIHFMNSDDVLYQTDFRNGTGL